jgi:hypothetical protein
MDVILAARTARDKESIETFNVKMDPGLRQDDGDRDQ